MALEGILIEHEFVCSIILVYGPHDKEEQRSLWDELCAFGGNVMGPLLVMGDFNEVINQEEHKRGRVLSQNIRDFIDWVQNMSLLELPLMGRKYTWSRNSSSSRIDRTFMDST